MSQFTDNESQSQLSRMSSLKRSRSSYASRSRITKRPRYPTRIPRMSKPGAAGNTSIVALTTFYDFGMTADPAYGFNFDTRGFYVNGTYSAIDGASELHAIYDMMRVMKVEISILPAATGLDYNSQTLSSGRTNIPYVYDAIDFNDGDAPTLQELRQNNTCKINIFNKIIKRTIYPRLEGANGVIDVGSNVKQMFMKSGNSSTQHWNGWKVFMDMKEEVWTYGLGRVSFKVFYECMQSK